MRKEWGDGAWLPRPAWFLVSLSITVKKAGGCLSKPPRFSDNVHDFLGKHFSLNTHACIHIRPTNSKPFPAIFIFYLKRFSFWHRRKEGQIVTKSVLARDRIGTSPEHSASLHSKTKTSRQVISLSISATQPCKTQLTFSLNNISQRKGGGQGPYFSKVNCSVLTVSRSA